jgi:hypothetical protein
MDTNITAATVIAHAAIEDAGFTPSTHPTDCFVPALKDELHAFSAESVGPFYKRSPAFHVVVKIETGEIVRAFAQPDE